MNKTLRDYCLNSVVIKMNLLLQLYIMLMLVAFLAAQNSSHDKKDSKEEELMDAKEHIDLRGSVRQRGVQFGWEYPEYPETRVYATSPLADVMALGKLALGTRGETHVELLEAIGIAHKSELADHFKPLIDDLRQLQGRGLKVDIVSRLYVSNNSLLDTEFEEDAMNIFQSSATKIDFQNSTLVAKDINSWVSLHTNCVINDVVENVALEPLILINAVFVCGKWKETFDNMGEIDWYSRNLLLPEDTAHGPQYKVSVMGRTGIYNYTFYKNKYDVIQIPYMDDRTSLILITSFFMNDLFDLLGNEGHKWVNKAISAMSETRVTLKMPFFTISGKNNLYERAGVKKIFNESSLEQITKDKFLHVAYHRTRTFLKVHRFGVNPAKPSNINSSDGSSTTRVTIDTPFVFFVLSNGQQLMSGVVKDPR